LNTVIRSATIVNEGRSFVADVLIKNDRIAKIAPNISVQGKTLEIDAEGLLLIPGVIDDQVHFREPGLTHKGDLFTESRAGRGRRHHQLYGDAEHGAECPHTKAAAGEV
jgi:dihydroorotase